MEDIPKNAVHPIASSELKSTENNEHKINCTVTENHNKTVREIMLSAVIMIAVAFFWAMSTQLTKTILLLNPKYFYAPYFMVWFMTNFMIASYPCYLSLALLFGNSSLVTIHKEALIVYGQNVNKIWSYFLLTILFLFFWMLANYAYSQSLGHISASASSSIMSCNTAMITVLAWIILRDRFISFKLISVGAAIAGVVIISVDKEFAGDSFGVFLSILSAFSAAFYKVLFKKFHGNASIGQVSLFLTGLGLLNFFFNSIPALLLLLMKAEIFTWSAVPWIPLFGVAFLSYLFNFLINFGIVLTHPLIISIGMLLGIPISAGNYYMQIIAGTESATTKLRYELN
ncbi:unnamed protein product [Thelazia callipaeda]|uniref:TPT domain-containing protein n=1 Tax=Thelazia callipaeda TaxID=103827 RepID=A0A0N5CUD1_THECL|nr:unnamed protein product [Thelazia callipaeda]